MGRRTIAASLSLFVAVFGPATGAVGQSGSPVESEDGSEQRVARSPFPSADEVGAIVGVDLETDGIHARLGHEWGGIDEDHDEALGAWTQSYNTPQETLSGQQVGVMVDIVHFETVEDAVRQVDEVMSADYVPGHETGLSADWVASHSHEEPGGATVASMFLREGPVAVAVSTFRWDTAPPEPSTTAVAGLVVDRIASLGEWLIVLAADADDPPPTAHESGAMSGFPTAAEVSEVLGVEVGIRGIEPGLSQLWEGIEFDWQELPSAYIGMYSAPPFETEEPLMGVVIDVAEFATVDDAIRHADGKFADYREGFETKLSGDYVLTHTFPSGDFDGSFIVLRDGLVIVVVTAMSFDGTVMEAASEEIVELVLRRLDDEA